MAGVKGRGGPPPKRSDQRRRSNPTAAEARTGEVRRGEHIPSDPPEAGDWLPAIRQWYESLAQSGQSAWYAASDWSSAWLMAEAMNAEMVADGVLKAATLSAWLKLCTALLVTEGDRRRSAVELALPAPPAADAPAEVTDIRSWRESLNA